MTSIRQKMESCLELLVQESKSTGRKEEALSATDSDAFSVSQSELTSPNSVAALSWADGDGSLAH